MATIKEIQEILSEITDIKSPVFEQFRDDSRAGVHKLIMKRKKQIQAELDEDCRLEQMLRYEKELYATGCQYIAGIDEVGRGPLAGPVVAAAVILPKNCKIKGLNDSKKIPKKKHEEIYQEVLKQAVAVGIGVKDNQVIDNLEISPQHLLIDAMQLDVQVSQTSIIKGDANSLSIAAASIVAKVTRDRMMTDYELTYPGYDFAHNVGYGTQHHLDGLKRKGITPIHRKTFEPIKSMLEEVEDKG